MGEFEKSRLEKALKPLSKENLCTVIEATGLSVKECLEENIKRASHSVLLRQASSRIDELSQEHWQNQKKCIREMTDIIGKSAM